MSHFSGDEVLDKDNKTGLIFDDRMSAHCCLWEPEMQEKPDRYLAPMEKIQKYGLLQKCCVLPPKLALEEELLRVHTKEYIDKIKKSAATKDVNRWKKLSSKYDGVFFNSHTYECALLAAGCSIELVSAVLQGKVNNGFAIVRPPGHHAMVNDACGYCFFNNVAIAAKHALESYNLNRILIVDWDVHHGQGTQQIFYDDPRVLYFSIHRYENGDFWPHLRESNFDFSGGHSAEGFNINVPLNSTGQGNAEYLAIFNNILLPIAYEFNPELVLISSGYDAALGCPEGEMKLTPPVYAHFINLLSCLARGKICVLLEGGYCISSLSESVAFTLKGLLGDPCCSLPPCVGVHESSIESILNVISVHRPFWDSIKLQNAYGFNVVVDDESSKHIVNIKYAGNPLEGLIEYQIAGYCPVQPQSLIVQLEKEIQNIMTKVDISVPNYQTGFIFDPRTTLNCSFENHVETADHIIYFYDKLQQSGLLSKCIYILPSQLSKLDQSKFSNYADKIQVDCVVSNEISEKLEKEFNMVQFCQKDESSVLKTFQSVLQLVDAVVLRKCVNGFALIRPMGHYPANENASGFCTFSSVNIVAKYLSIKHKIGKILIVDLNIGCRNSVQNFFYEDNRVLYVSLLHHDEKSHTSLEAKLKQVGSNKGEGFNVNIPFSHTICDGDYIAALFHLILPIGYEFCPEFVILSLGYDDGKHGTGFSSSFVTIITKFLSGLSNGKIVVVSENNLSCEKAPDSAAHCLSALLNEPCVPLKKLKPTLEGINVIRNVLKVQKNFWKSLAFDVEVPCNLGSEEEKDQ